MVVDASSPVHAKVGDNTAILRNDILTVNQLHTTEAWATIAISGNVAKFNERMSPIDRIQGKAQELLKPCLVEIVQRIILHIAILVNNLEGASHDKALALFDTSRKVSINISVTVNVIETLTVGTFHTDCHLPSIAPVLHVGTCKCLGGTLKLCHNLLDIPTSRRLGKVVVTIFRVQDVRLACNVLY